MTSPTSSPFHLGTDPWVLWAKAEVQLFHLQKENTHLVGLLGGVNEIIAVSRRLYSTIEVCAIIIFEGLEQFMQFCSPSI